MNSRSKGRSSISSFSILPSSPAIARAIPEAIKGYRRLHLLALKLLETNGILVSCCCTGLITMEMLEDVIAQVGVVAKRTTSRSSNAAGRAPITRSAVSCRRGSYLKCIFEPGSLAFVRSDLGSRRSTESAPKVAANQLVHFAISTFLVSRITVTLISPG